MSPLSADSDHHDRAQNRPDDLGHLWWPRGIWVKNVLIIIHLLVDYRVYKTETTFHLNSPFPPPDVFSAAVSHSALTPVKMWSIVVQTARMPSTCTSECETIMLVKVNSFLEFSRLTLDS